jgi:hypothetical protein
MPGVKLREKGKKESQVFPSVADNPRLVYRYCPVGFAKRPSRQVMLGFQEPLSQLLVLEE